MGTMHKQEALSMDLCLKIVMIMVYSKSLTKILYLKKSLNMFWRERKYRCQVISPFKEKSVYENCMDGLVSWVILYICVSYIRAIDMTYPKLSFYA